MNGTAPDTLTGALGLARLGLRVFPLKPGAKAPALKRWPELAASGAAAAEAMWAEARQSYGSEPNVAVATGQGIMVLDVDDKDGKSGSATLEVLQIEHHYLPITLTADTANGGEHLYFRIPEGFTVGNSIGKLGAGLDVKGERGYVVAPPSSLSSGAYRWREGLGPGDIDIAMAPEWLLERCCKKNSASEVAAPRAMIAPATLQMLDRDCNVEWAREWLRDEAPESIETADGYPACTVVIQKLYDRGLSPPKALELLMEEGGWNETKAVPPWSDGELEGRAWGLWGARDRPPGCEARYPASEQFDAVDPSPISMQKPGSGKIRLEPIGDFAKGALSNPLALVDGLLGFGDASVFFGPPNSGKSFVMLTLAYCIACGLPFGRQETSQGAVVYLAAEGESSLRDRTAALRQRFGSLDGVSIRIGSASIDLANGADDARAIIEVAKQSEAETGCPVVLIIVDTLAQAMTGDENSPVDFGKLLRTVNAIRRETGAHVALVHHTGKDVSKGARGHSSLLGNLDTAVEITPEGKSKSRKTTGTLKNTKQRRGELLPALVFELEPVDLGTDEKGKAISVPVLRFPDSADAFFSSLSAMQNTTLAAFDVAVSEGDGSGIVAGKAWDSAIIKVLPRGKNGHAASPKDRTLRQYRQDLARLGLVERIGRDQWVRTDLATRQGSGNSLPASGNAARSIQERAACGRGADPRGLSPSTHPCRTLSEDQNETAPDVAS